MNTSLHLRTIALCAILFGWLVSAPASAAYVTEPFNTNSTNLAADYPAYQVTGAGGSAAVVSQQLNLLPAGGGTTKNLLTNAAYGFVDGAQVEATSTGGVAGNHNVGLFLGTGDPGTLGPNDNTVVFHPGFSGGALCVDGPGGFGNQNVGFTPAQGVLHLLDVQHDGLGNFSVTLTNGSNSLQSFTMGWMNTALAAAPFKVGLTTFEAFSGTPTGVFDNWVVTPEPGALVLAGGAAGILALGRRRLAGHR